MDRIPSSPIELFAFLTPLHGGSLPRGQKIEKQIAVTSAYGTMHAPAKVDHQIVEVVTIRSVIVVATAA